MRTADQLKLVRSASYVPSNFSPTCTTTLQRLLLLLQQERMENILNKQLSHTTKQKYKQQNTRFNRHIWLVCAFYKPTDSNIFPAESIPIFHQESRKAL